MKKLMLLAAVIALPVFADPPATSLFATPHTTAQTANAITTQTDNMRIEATVKWLGPSTLGSLIAYNGNGCCSGWGILVLASTDSPSNAVAVLAGGNVVVASTITLTPNKWQHVTMDRVAGNVTLTVSTLSDDDDAPPPQTANLGFIPVNFIGHLAAPHTYVGDAFNGFIRNVSFSDITGSPAVIESWDFTHAPATSGKLNLYSSPVGANGHVLSNFTNSWAVPAHGND